MDPACIPTLSRCRGAICRPSTAPPHCHIIRTSSSRSRRSSCFCRWDRRSLTCREACPLRSSSCRRRRVVWAQWRPRCRSAQCRRLTSACRSRRCIAHILASRCGSRATRTRLQGVVPVRSHLHCASVFMFSCCIGGVFSDSLVYLTRISIYQGIGLEGHVY